MNDIWAAVRMFDFLVLFVCFCVLMYRAIDKVLFHPTFFSWDRMANLVWCVCITYALGESLYTNTPGGPRVFVTSFAVLFQAYVIFFRSPYLSPDTEGRSE